MFAEKYLRSLNTSDLRDDEQHCQTEALVAASVADRSARNIGALLHRVKYGSSYSQVFEGDNHALSSLRREWLDIVAQKGRDRKWIKTEDWARIGYLLPRLVEKVATASLAHYLDGNCRICTGTGRSALLQTCRPCNGTGQGAIASTPEVSLNSYEIELTRQMVGELMALEQAHAGVASAKLRRVY